MTSKQVSSQPAGWTADTSWILLPQDHMTAQILPAHYYPCGQPFPSPADSIGPDTDHTSWKNSPPSSSTKGQADLSNLEEDTSITGDQARSRDLKELQLYQRPDLLKGCKTPKTLSETTN